MGKKEDVIEVARHFRGQPIVKASSLKIHGVELLSRSIFSYSHDSMTKIDMKAVKCAAKLISLGGVFRTVHFNAEIGSIMNPDWIAEAVYHSCEGMVLEVVERNNLLDSKIYLNDFCAIVDVLRRFGLKVAMDDVDLEKRSLKLVEVIKPEIIKVDCPAYIPTIQQNFDAEIVLERIEDKEEAKQSLSFGVDYFQGYYYDLLFSDELPSCLTPPGVMSQKIKKSLEING